MTVGQLIADLTKLDDWNQIVLTPDWLEITKLIVIPDQGVILTDKDPLEGI